MQQQQQKKMQKFRIETLHKQQIILANLFIKFLQLHKAEIKLN